MERDDRPPVATFFVDAAVSVGDPVSLDDNASHHVRVKRLAVGDPVALTNGAGIVARGTLADVRRRSIEVAIERTQRIPAAAPIHLRVPIADRDRMLWLAEKATELGIASWQSVRFRRSRSVSPRGEGPAFAEKVRARMIAALEQSGGAWLPTILSDAELETVAVGGGAPRVVLVGSGAPLLEIVGVAERREPVLLFGPEGGIEAEELAWLGSAGWEPATLGSTTLRFETAGIAAVSIVRAAQLLAKSERADHG